MAGIPILDPVWPPRRADTVADAALAERYDTPGSRIDPAAAFLYITAIDTGMGFPKTARKS